MIKVRIYIVEREHKIIKLHFFLSKVNKPGTDPVNDPDNKDPVNDKLLRFSFRYLFINKMKKVSLIG